MTIKQDIQHRITAFAAELEELIRRAAIEAVGAALGQGASRAAARVSAAATKAKAKAKAAPRKGAKRDPKEIDALTARTAAWIEEHPGKRIEDIGKALGKPTSELVLPITRLLGNKTLKKTGVKRATKYYPR